MKLPDIPGRIMVQMAMAPQRAMNQRSDVVSVGDSRHMKAPRAIPARSQAESAGFHPLMSESMNITETTINPKKKAQVCTGWCASTYSISLASENTLITTPIASQSRNVPFMVFQNSLNCPFKAIFQVETLIRAFNESISSLKIPVSKAMVPPETPGITFAAPMANPLSATTMFLNMLVISTGSCRDSS